MPLKIIRENAQFIMISEAISVEEMNVLDDLFELPKGIVISEWAHPLVEVLRTRIARVSLAQRNWHVLKFGG